MLAKETKYCKSCNKTLPIEMFSIKKSSKDGLQRCCKTCDKKAQEEYRNKEKLELVRKILAMLEPYKSR